MCRTTFNLKKYLPLFLLSGCLVLGGCEQTAKQYDYSIFAFGTLIDISLYDVNKQQADETFNLLQQNFDLYHQRWSPWTDGDLAHLNKLIANTKPGADTAINVPSHLIPVLKRSILLSEKSNHYYNPAIGQLINLWQFHQHKNVDIKPPDATQIQALLEKKPKMSDLSFNQQNQLISNNPAVSLNFGAFAKGYAIALEIEKLKQQGIHHAVINAGGDLSVIGQHGDRAWNIGIRHPRNENMLASIELKDNESVFTSGDYERLYYYKNKRYHHILDPTTGYPAQGAQSVTVIHSNAGLADAAATALFVAGSKNWQKTAKSMGIELVLLIDAGGNIRLTEKMLARIKFLNKSPTSHIFVSEEL